MIEKRLMKGVIALGLLLVSGGVLAEDAAAQLEVMDPYVRAIPPGQMNSASFMTLRNNAAADHALVAVESPAAPTVELHTHTMEGGMMRMRRIEKIDLPAGEAVQLQPGGLHVMLIGITEPLAVDSQVELTLVLDDGSRTTVQAPVRKLQMQMMPMDQDHGMPHGH